MQLQKNKVTCIWWTKACDNAIRNRETLFREFQKDRTAIKRLIEARRNAKKDNN